MPISDVASLFGGAALGAPFSEILKLVIEEAKKVKDFKPLSQDLASTMERLVPVLTEIDSMQQGLDPSNGELKVLVDTIERAKEMVCKCSRVQWYSIAKKTSYTRKIQGINQDFLRFCQIELQVIQYKNQLKYMRPTASVTAEIDQLSETGKEFAELFLVPQPQEVELSWLDRPLRELKKMLFEDGVVTVVVSAPSTCGKTTLVTKLCHDADVKGKFKQIFFITMSKEPNVRLTLQRILEHTGCSANESVNYFDARLCIQQLLIQLGKSGSILLVLDDVWPEEESLLENFLIQLPDYKILVTSRFELPSYGTTFHLEPLIHEDVKKLFIEYIPQPNCQCAKFDHFLQKILKRCNGLPLVVSPPRSMCGGCNVEIDHGKSVDFMGVLWHPDCLWCDACHKQFTIHGTENLVSNSRGNFHKSCFGRYCYICKAKVRIREFNQHPFWKEKYCPAHESDGTVRCCSCERLEPRGTNFVIFEDRRRLCLECMESTVMDTDEVQHLHFDIREYFEGLNMKIEKEFPLLLVEKQALNKAEEEEGIDYQSEVVTRALCLSEELIISAVAERLKMEPNKQLVDIRTERQEVVRTCEVTAILILYGFPRVMTGYILAHEMMHAYLRLNGHKIVNNVMEEGICQVLGHMWLESQIYAPVEAEASSSASVSSHIPAAAACASKKGKCSDFERKLVEFCKNQIETNGMGFKRVNQMVVSDDYNLKETLKKIIIPRKS